MNGAGFLATRWRGCALAAFAAFAAVAVALPAAAAVTHVDVRFRERALGLSAPEDYGRLQAIALALGTGIGGAVVTRDGAYRVAPAPALSDAGVEAALGRLRMDRSVLYAEAFDAGKVAPQARATPDARSPRLARIIVKFRDARLAADAAENRPLSDARVSQLSARAGRPLAFGRNMRWAGAQILHLMRKAPQDEVEAIAAAIAQDPDVEWAEPDYLMFPQRVPNDPLYANQWHYMPPASAAGGANLPPAWDRTTGWSGIRIAVLDTGALFAHPDLATRFIGGYDFIYDWVTGNDNDPSPAAPCFANPLAAGCDNRDASAADPGDWISPEDDAGATFGGWLQGCGVDASSWHGSHVAGTIGAQSDNASGVAGVNWTSRIVPVRVLGKCGGYNSDIADGVVWAAGGTVGGVPANPLPARVLNLSLGGYGACSATFQDAINAALALDAVVVISAGNANGDAAGASPGNCNGVVTVAAVGRVGQRASYSNYGTTVEIAAPGGSDGDFVLSTLNAGTTGPASMIYLGYNGTSMAAPHVAGVASLLLSLKPSLTPAQVTSILQNNARPFPSGTIRGCTSVPGSVVGGVQYCGAGMLDANLALANVAMTGGPGNTPLLASITTGTSAPNPSFVGASVTLQATVTGTSPTGTVTFTQDDVPLAGCIDRPLAGAGNAKTAQCTTTALPAGALVLRAAYSGDAAHRPSDSPHGAHTVQNITPQPTTTALTSSLNPSAQGASITLTATVTGTGPTGTLRFRAGGATIAGCDAVALAGAGTSRSGQCTTAALPAANNVLEAVYGGDHGNLASTGTLFQGVIGPGACTSFNDVLASSPFCQHVQWLSNRAITLGCTSVEYCPDSGVSRLAMAAFMRRKGDSLTPFDVPLVGGSVGLDLSTPRVTCFNPSGNYAVTGFPRRAKLKAAADLYAPGASTVVTVQHAYSTDGGTSWTPIPSTAVAQSMQAGRTPVDDRTVVVHGEFDLEVGTSYLFGLSFSASPTVTTMSVYCSYQSRIFSRTGVVTPF